MRTQVIERVQWARLNDAKVQKIAKRAVRFADEQLNDRCSGHALRLILAELSRQARARQAHYPPPPPWDCPADCVRDEEFVPAWLR
jgi:hypothetical protein